MVSRSESKSPQQPEDADPRIAGDDVSNQSDASDLEYAKDNCPGFGSPPVTDGLEVCQAQLSRLPIGTQMRGERWLRQRQL